MVSAAACGDIGRTAGMWTRWTVSEHRDPNSLFNEWHKCNKNDPVAASEVRWKYDKGFSEPVSFGGVADGGMVNFDTCSLQDLRKAGMPSDLFKAMVAMNVVNSASFKDDIEPGLGCWCQESTQQSRKFPAVLDGDDSLYSKFDLNSLTDRLKKTVTKNLVPQLRSWLQRKEAKPDPGRLGAAMPDDLPTCSFSKANQDTGPKICQDLENAANLTRHSDPALFVGWMNKTTSNADARHTLFSAVAGSLVLAFITSLLF
jgi:hypothetical protein